MKLVADRDLSLIPKKLDLYRIIGGYTLLLIKNNNIRFITNLKHSETKDILNERINLMKSLLEKLKPLPDIIIPFYFADSYMWDYNGPYFCYSKPANKNGLLFPNWNFNDWEKTKEEFKKQQTKKEFKERDSKTFILKGFHHRKDCLKLEKN